MPDNHLTQVDGYRCTDGHQTLVDLAAVLDDMHWEQGLESALRKKLATVEQLQHSLHQRRIGNGRIRRVLKLRPADVPPTESLLETLMVQLVRRDPSLPTPERQVEVFNRHGRLEARVDLAWPSRGVFVELDGQQHNGQPVYDANRQTRVIAATGWLVGRFTWSEVRHNPKPTLRRLSQLLEIATTVRQAG